MADDRHKAVTLGAWEQSLSAYLHAAEALFRRGALARRPEAVELDLLEVLNKEQTDALDRYLETSREAERATGPDEGPAIRGA